MPSTDRMPAAGVAEITQALRDALADTLKIVPAALDGAQTHTLQERGLRSLGALRVQYLLHERLGLTLALDQLLGARALDELAQRVHAQTAVEEPAVQ